MRSLLLLLLLAACTSSAPPPLAERARQAPATPELRRGPVGDRDYWVTRTDAELDEVLDTACAAAVADGKPLLLQFSAPWCPDCRRVRALSASGPLHEELSGWHSVIVDPGRWERHQDLLGAFGVSALVAWIAVRPDSCKLPAPAWPRLRQGVFEPQTGTPWTAGQLQTWLVQARTGTVPPADTKAEGAGP